MIYLDHAATTPISDKALEVYVNVSKHYFGNASSMHDEGSSAKQILDASAKTVAATLNARVKDMYFTSGATEASYLAINSFVKGNEASGRHLITTPIEHSSVRNIFLSLKEEGYEISEVEVDEYGKVKLDKLKELVREDTILASIQHVNSELGITQDLAEIGEFLHSKGVILHSDCVQSYGRFRLDVTKMNVDAISISGHKIYGPKGVGAVWMNPKAIWKPVLKDPDHPGQLRSGTVDVPSIAAFATAAKMIHEDQDDEQKRIGIFRKEVIEGLIELGFDLEVLEHPTDTVPNILGIRFAGMEGQYLMLECNQAGLAISTGSACQVGSDKPNRSLMAIGKSAQEAREFIRLSFGSFNTKDQIPLIIEKMSGILNKHYKKVYHSSN